MAKLIDFDVPHSQLRNLLSPAKDKMFGVIKRECFAVEVGELDPNIRETLQPGTLIQILPDCRGEVCHFKIRNFTKWVEKYKTAIYKFNKADYITVKREFWRYLMGLKNDEGLLKLVENINKMEFDLDMLKLGSEIRIRRPPGNMGKYYEFVVAYNGLMEEMGIGYYIGLQLKNDHAPLTSDLKSLSEYYRFEGIGIVVQIDWIMMNLYADEERGPEPQQIQYNDASSDETNDSETKNTNFNDIQNQLPIEVSKRISGNSASNLVENGNNNVQIPPITREQRIQSPEIQTTFNFATKTGYNNNANGAMKMSETAAMPECNKKNTDQNHVVSTFTINEQSSKTPCGSSSNDEDFKISESGDIPHKREHHVASTSLINEESKPTTVSPSKNETNNNAFETEFKNNTKMSETRDVPNNHLQLSKDFDVRELNKNSLYCMPKNIIDIGATSERSDQLLKFSRETTTNYNDVKTEFSNNADEAVKMNETLTGTLPIGSAENILQVPSKHRNQSPETPYDSGSTYGSQIESGQILPIGWTTNNESNGVSIPGSISEQRYQKFELPCDGDGDLKMSETRVVLNNNPIFPNAFDKHELNKDPLYSRSNNISHDVKTSSTNQYTKYITETADTLKYREQLPKTDGAMRNTEETKCNFCSITVEIFAGFTLRECTHSFCTDCICFHVDKCNLKESKIQCPYKKGYKCIFSLKDAEIKDFRGETIYNKIPTSRLENVKDNVAEGEPLLDSVHEPDDHKPRLKPTNLQSQIQYETDSSSKQFDQSPENSCDTTLNYAAEIESVTNADGAVRNAEQTCCDSCNKTVEIGDGFILRECLHSFCANCIRHHVYRHSKCSKIQCPYKKDYECNFDLQDVEIKDLGGEKIYNTIVENRLKEYMATEPNARWCPNKACGNVWVSERVADQQNERCPKCNVNLCLICKKAHEPDDRHENKSMITTFSDKVKNTISAYRPQLGGNCAKCHRTNIPANKYIKLKNCRHTICTNCVLPMIKSQTLNSHHAQCIICNVYLEDFEIAGITRFEASIQSHNVNRKIQPEVAAPLELCICGPSRGNCKTTLKCNHTFCQTYITNIVREQFNINDYAACPRCLHKIDENIIRHLVPGLIKEEIVEKCRICPERVQFHLINCQHGFCLNCIRHLIMEQVFDANKMSVICTVCNMQVRNDDISRYGGQEIFAGYKLKIENEAINRPYNKQY